MPIGYDEYRELEYELGLGDARRCPSHPNVKISSDDGVFDGVCDLCEGEADRAYEADRWAALSPEERHAIEAQVAAYSASRTEWLANQDDVGF